MADNLRKGESAMAAQCRAHIGLCDGIGSGGTGNFCAAGGGGESAGSSRPDAESRASATRGSVIAAGGSSGAIDYPGYERLMECGEEWLQAGEDGPGVTEGALEYPISMKTSFKDEAALFYDYNMRRLAQTEAMAELHIGRGLNSLKHRLMDCGYARMEDFAREELGISGRLASELMRHAAMLAKFPALCGAYCSGMVKRTALRSLLKVVTSDNEEELLRQASTKTVREIEEMVKEMKRATGAIEEPGDDPVFTLSVIVSQAIAARFDYAYERFCRMEEGDRPLGEFIEALCAEFVAFNPAFIAGKEGVAGKGTAASRSRKGKGGVDASHPSAWWEKGCERFLSGEKSIVSQCVRDHGDARDITRSEECSDSQHCSDSHGSGDSIGCSGSYGSSSSHCCGRFQGFFNCDDSSGSHNACIAHGSNESGAQPGSCTSCGTASGTDLSSALLAFDDGMKRIVHRQEEEWRARQEREAYFREVRIGCEIESNRWEFLPSYPLYIELARDMRCASQDTSRDGAFRDDASRGGYPRDARPHDVAATLKRLVRLRTTLAMHQGVMLHSFSNHKLARAMLFSSPGHYVRERLGMSRSTAYRRMALDRLIREYPPLGDKVASGALSLLKAELVGRVLCEGTHRKEEWVGFAEASTVRELSREVEAYRRIAGGTLRMRWSYFPGSGQEDSATSGEEGESPAVSSCAKMGDLFAGQEGAAISPCAKSGDASSGKEESLEQLLIPLERSLIPLFQKALALYEAHCLIAGHEPSQQHFLALMVMHFLKVHGKKKATSLHLRILERDDYRCQVPGCTCRRNLQAHHIIFRSRGGTDDEWNLITLCSSHHLPGVHEGRLIIEGKAPHNIVVRFPAGVKAA
jgi:hypothetical protein